MSNKPRTEAQKKRRAYVEKCHKEGKKPLPVDKWCASLGDSKKEKEVKKAVKAHAKKVVKNGVKNGVGKDVEKPSVKGRVVYIHRGDEVHFDDYTAVELADFAQGVIRLALSAFAHGH